MLSTRMPLIEGEMKTELVRSGCLRSLVWFEDNCQTKIRTEIDESTYRETVGMKGIWNALQDTTQAEARLDGQLRNLLARVEALEQRR